MRLLSVFVLIAAFLAAAAAYGYLPNSDLENHGQDNEDPSLLPFGGQMMHADEQLFNSLVAFVNMVELARASKDDSDSSRPHKSLASARSSKRSAFALEQTSSSASLAPCSGIGVEFLGISTWNKCSGNNCSLYELSCNGQIVLANQINGSISGCLVRSLLCYNERRLAFEVVAVPLQTGSAPTTPTCEIEKFKCEGVIVPVADMAKYQFKYLALLNETTPSNPQKNSTENGEEDQDEDWVAEYDWNKVCLAQVRCGTKFYGFKAFDYDCKNQELKCNGTLIDKDLVNSTLVSRKCAIVDIPCRDVSDSNETCTSIQRSCNVSPLESICPSFLSHHGTCLTPAPTVPTRCLPSALTCTGRPYTYPGQPGSLAVCESVNSVQCNDFGLIQLGSEFTVCRIAAFECYDSKGPASRVAFTTQASVPNNCTISEMLCSPIENPLNCKVHKFGCEKPCIYSQSESVCEDQCQQVGLSSHCRCPVDRTGPECEKLVPLTCHVEMTSPLKNCSSSPRIEVPICIEVKSTDRISVNFNLSCALSGVQFNPRAASEFSYNYTYTNLALSEPLSDYRIRAKIYNFNELSDDTHVSYVPLKPEYLEGLQTVAFDLDIPSLDKDKYVIGNRIYIEYRLENVHNKSLNFTVSKPKINTTDTNKTKTKPKKDPSPPFRQLKPRVLAREMFDVMDLAPIPPRAEDETLYWVIAGIAVALMLGLIGFVIYKWRTSLKPRPKEKRL